MTWQAYVTGLSDGRVAIVYADGTQKVERSYTSDRLDDDFIKQAARGEIARLEVAAAAAGKLTLEVGQEIDLTPPVPPVVVPPKPDPSAAFFAAYRELQALNRGAANGIAVDSARQAELLDTCKAMYLPEYGAML